MPGSRAQLCLGGRSVGQLVCVWHVGSYCCFGQRGPLGDWGPAGKGDSLLSGFKIQHGSCYLSPLCTLLVGSCGSLLSLSASSLAPTIPSLPSTQCSHLKMLFGLWLLYSNSSIHAFAFRMESSFSHGSRPCIINWPPRPALGLISPFRLPSAAPHSLLSPVTPHRFCTCCVFTPRCLHASPLPPFRPLLYLRQGPRPPTEERSVCPNPSLPPVLFHMLKSACLVRYSTV